MSGQDAPIITASSAIVPDNNVATAMNENN